MLLALQERQFRIEVGYGLEGTLTDGKTGRIQDEYIIPYLKQNDWNNGIKNGFSAILNEVSKEYNVEVGTKKVTSAKNMTNNQSISYIVTSFSGFGIPIISFIIGRILKKKNFKKGRKLLIFGIYIIIVGIVNYFIYNIFSTITGSRIINNSRIFNNIWFYVVYSWIF